MSRKHIHRLATLISENVDEYAGLEDADEFKQPTANGYGCGNGCWEYEEFPFNVGGQMLLGTATISYSADVQHHKEYRATLEEPGEPAWAEVSIGDHSVDLIEVYDNDGEMLNRWHRAAGKKWNRGEEQTWDAGFAAEGGILTDEQLNNIISQVSQQFVNDEDQVQEYERENSDDYDDRW